MKMPSVSAQSPLMLQRARHIVYWQHERAPAAVLVISTEPAFAGTRANASRTLGGMAATDSHCNAMHHNELLKVDSGRTVG